MTRLRMTRAAGFALLCAASLPALAQAVSAGEGYRIEQAESESSATVVFTVSVSLDRMEGPRPPSLECELRSDRSFGSNRGRYGLATPALNVDSVSGTGSTTISSRLRIIDTRSDRERPIGADKPVHVRCRLLPAPDPDNPNPQWEVSKQPQSPSRSSGRVPTYIVKPGAVLEASGLAQ